MSAKPPVLATLSPVQLSEIRTLTLGHYNDSAEAFWLGTKSHDVSQNIATLLRHLPSPGQHTILDFGCGPGRDLLVLRDLGHTAVGVDGAAKLVAMAKQHSGCEVLHQDFLALDLPRAHFDGVFANASLFHVPSQQLSTVLAALWGSLKPGGVLFSSNPHGRNREGWSGDRYGCYLDLETYRQFMSGAGFAELEHYYRPSGKLRHQQPWLASVWRRDDRVAEP